MSTKHLHVSVHADKGDSENNRGLACMASRWCSAIFVCASAGGERRRIRMASDLQYQKRRRRLDNSIRVRQCAICVRYAVSRETHGRSGRSWMSKTEPRPLPENRLCTNPWTECSIPVNRCTYTSWSGSHALRSSLLWMPWWEESS